MSAAAALSGVAHMLQQNGISQCFASAHVSSSFQETKTTYAACESGAREDQRLGGLLCRELSLDLAVAGRSSKLTSEHCRYLASNRGGCRCHAALE